MATLSLAVVVVVVVVDDEMLFGKRVRFEGVVVVCVTGAVLTLLLDRPFVMTGVLLLDVTEFLLFLRGEFVVDFESGEFVARLEYAEFSEDPGEECKSSSSSRSSIPLVGSRSASVSKSRSS